MRRLKKPKYRFDVKRINIHGKEVEKDKDITASELFERIVRTKSRRRHR